MNQPVAAILLGCSDPVLLRRMSGADASLGAPPPMVALVKRLTAAGIVVTVVDDLQEARAVAGLRDRPPRAAAAMDDSGMVATAGAALAVTPVLVDLEACSSDDPEDLETARRQLGDCRHAFGGQGPIAITSGAPPRMLLECFRAGATDVIDLVHEGTARARSAVQRACAAEQHRRAEAEVTREQRELLDELVRDLVRTERRMIDLEQRLEHPAPPPTSGDGVVQAMSHGASGRAPSEPAIEGAGAQHERVYLERVYLERIRSRHEQLLARYLGLKSAQPGAGGDGV
jgi:hypothetical protein